MVQADARARTRHDAGMARPRTRTRAGERSRAVIRGSGTELPAEGAREHLMAAKAHIPGNQSHLPVARQKLMGGTLEPQAHRVLLRRLTEEFAQGPMEVERGPSGTVGQRLEAPRAKDHTLNDAQKFVPAHGWIINPPVSDA